MSFIVLARSTGQQPGAQHKLSAAGHEAFAHEPVELLDVTAADADAKGVSYQFP